MEDVNSLIRGTHSKNICIKKIMLKMCNRIIGKFEWKFLSFIAPDTLYMCIKPLNHMPCYISVNIWKEIQWLKTLRWKYMNDQ